MKNIFNIIFSVIISLILIPGEVEAHVSVDNTNLCKCSKITDGWIYEKYVNETTIVDNINCELGLDRAKCETHTKFDNVDMSVLSVVTAAMETGNCPTNPGDGWSCAYHSMTSKCGCIVGDSGKAACRRYYYYDNGNKFSEDLNQYGAIPNPRPQGNDKCEDIEKPQKCCCSWEGSEYTCSAEYIKSDNWDDVGAKYCSASKKEAGNPIDGSCEYAKLELGCCCLPAVSGFSTETETCIRITRNGYDEFTLKEQCEFDAFPEHPSVKKELRTITVEDGKESECGVTTKEIGGGSTTGSFNFDIRKEAVALNPMNFKTGTDGINLVIGRVVRYMLMFIGSISLVLYIYAGILWMASAGNSENVGKAKKILLWTTLGLVVMLSSYWIVSTVLSFMRS